MSTPVINPKWAGVFACSLCRRKRLTAESFSGKQIDNFRKKNTPLKCKACVAEMEAKTSATAAAARALKSAATEADANGEKVSAEGEDDTKVCTLCSQSLPLKNFSRTQQRSATPKCIDCTTKFENEQKNASEALKQDKLIAASKRVAEANKTSNVFEKMAANAELAALEAEKVTGLKPKVLNSKGMRGRGRGHRGGRT
jgi:hypothetical protein